MTDVQLPKSIAAIKFIEITPITFVMGNDLSDGEKTHETSLPHKISVASHPITCDEYNAFLTDDNGFKNPEWWEFSDGALRWFSNNESLEYDLIGPNHPRVNVCWYESVAFCRWLSHFSTDYNYRLLSEGEWELLSRGTDGRLFPWGNSKEINRCNLKESGISTTNPVEMYPTHDYPYPGLTDLVGNVYEWCLDVWWENAYPYSWKDNRRSVELYSSDPRVIRGGAFDESIDSLTACTRVPVSPRTRGHNIGFRIARVFEGDPYLVL